VTFGFDLSRFYCAHHTCVLHPAVEGFVNAAAVRTHLYEVHGTERAKIESGEDYFEGWQARTVYLRRSAEAEQATKKAARYLVQPDYSVADFLTDAGDEPWPALEYE
jgi:hypothetical protein